MIKVKKKTLTPAQVIACFTVPIIVLDAPASNYVNNILGISHELTFNTAAYTGATHLYYDLIRPGVTIIAADSILTAGGDVCYPASKALSTSQLPTSTTNDLFVTTNAQAATGDSDVILYIIYETIKITP